MFNIKKYYLYVRSTLIKYAIINFVKTQDGKG